MTSVQRFCPTCGAPTPDEPLDERGRCRTCYLEEHELVTLPESMTISRCTGCGSIELDGSWIDVDDDTTSIAIDRVADSVRVFADVEELTWEARTEPLDDRTLVVTGLFDLFIDGGWERRELTTEVTFEPTACQRCSRIAGDDFGATVQLRATERSPADSEVTRARTITADVLDSRVEAGDRDAYLTDVKERPEGIDFRLSTPRLGDQVTTAIRRDLGGTLSTSRTLVTTDGDGREVYRVTFTLRLGRFRPGDILQMNTGVLLVEGGAERLRVIDLKTGDRRTVAADDLEASKVATIDDAEAVTVVARIDDRAVQVLHPETYEAVTVSYYDGIDVDAETVSAIEVDGSVYLIPDDV